MPKILINYEQSVKQQGRICRMVDIPKKWFTLDKKSSIRTGDDPT
jgi:hypothetical protein